MAAAQWQERSGATLHTVVRLLSGANFRDLTRMDFFYKNMSWMLVPMDLKKKNLKSPEKSLPYVFFYTIQTEALIHTRIHSPL